MKLKIEEEKKDKTEKLGLVDSRLLHPVRRGLENDPVQGQIPEARGQCQCRPLRLPRAHGCGDRKSVGRERV